MATATNVVITQITTTTINDTPYIVALGEDGGIFAMNLTIAVNKELNSSWVQLPPIYIPDGYEYPLIQSGSDILPNVTPLKYTTI